MAELGWGFGSTWGMLPGILLEGEMFGGSCARRLCQGLLGFIDAFCTMLG